MSKRSAREGITRLTLGVPMCYTICILWRFANEYVITVSLVY